MLKTKVWRKRLRVLRRRFPVAGKVKVIRRPCKRESGATVTDGCGNYTIRISSDQDWQSQIDALLHEWAHMLAIEEAYSHRPPGRWGEIYAEIYSATEDEFCKDPKEKA
jgi:hypothetical protein